MSLWDVWPELDVEEACAALEVVFATVVWGVVVV